MGSPSIPSLRGQAALEGTRARTKTHGKVNRLETKLTSGHKRVIFQFHFDLEIPRKNRVLQEPDSLKSRLHGFHFILPTRLRLCSCTRVRTHTYTQTHTHTRTRIHTDDGRNEWQSVHRKNSGVLQISSVWLTLREGSIHAEKSRRINAPSGSKALL